MKTTIEMTGFLERVLEKAVDAGIARSKTDALRIGVLELNHHYHLVPDASEAELVTAKMERLDRETQSGKRKMLTENDVFKKYPQLSKIRK